MRIILVGYGVVGQSLTKLFLSRRDELVKNYGFRPRIVAVVDRGGAIVNPKGLDMEKILSAKTKRGTVAAYEAHGRPNMSAFDVIESVDAEVMVEVSPTNVKDGEPALSHIKTAFRTGKHVVTSNKGPLALALPALTELAEHNKVYFKFSGSVGAGTPVLEFAKKCLYGDRITSIKGVLNGTTNYILTEMAERQITFERALQKAKELGYAEADPSMDVDGIDTACKIVILANWVMGKKVTLKDVKVKGIRDVTIKDMEEAAKHNCTIKLIGSVNDKLEVKPEKVLKDSPLSVSGTLNAVTFISEFAGEQTVIGRGAGGTETASAILRDLLDIKQKLAAKLLLEI
ncbi:MAG: homoserine dehydrogenase [Nitrososphaerota archaeon]|nr:homoserine dehydrogenase [Candidatus Bathyarchaeota archaeon]MDW8022321.1 homoserine dehydrogenase [Nitrososphaerota archaeon]